MSVRSRSALVAAVVAVALAAGALVIIFNAGPATAKPFATLEITAGGAEIQRASGGGFRAATDGAGLRPGDTIRTPPDGRATIEYFDGSVTRLDFGTTFTIRRLASEPDGTTVIDAVHTTGATFNRVVELTGAQSRFDVETPTAVASVRGTVLFTEVRADGGSRIGVIDGEILVTTESGALRLIAGRGVDVDATGNAGAPFILTPEMLGSGWLYYNLCVLDQVPGACDEVGEPEPKEKEKERSRERRDPGPLPSPPSDAAPPPPEQDQTRQQEEENQSGPGGLTNNGSTQSSQEPPPPPAATYPPPTPPPSPRSGKPPCDNPGQGTPCDGPGKAGSPPGQDKPKP